jgi:coiled-coil domain-containing protein 130
MQGFNMGRYRPYDSDPRKESFNARTGTHPLGKRAHKSDQGILIVRFELPFNIWCEGCQGHIGQGVRFNAEKKREGEYYSTPIYSFRCKTACCQNYFVIKTDPKNTRYVVESGARQQNSGWDPEEVGGFPLHDDGKGSTSEMPLPDAFSALEKTISDKAMAKTRGSRIDELQEAVSARAEDPYALNAALRSQFRRGRRERQAMAKRDDDLKGRIGWKEGLSLAAEEESEAEMKERERLWSEAKDRRAGIGSDRPPSTPSRLKIAAASSRMTKSKEEAKTALAARLLANTKKRTDPF